MPKIEQKEPFVFTDIKPCLDWFTMEKVTINPDDYTYFRLNRRYGPSWWIYGMKTVETPDYHWEETELGEICEADLMRFIEWAKYKDGGSRIVKINMISGSFNIFDELSKLQKSSLIKENQKLKLLIDRAAVASQGDCRLCRRNNECANRKGSHQYCWEYKFSYTEKD